MTIAANIESIREHIGSVKLIAVSKTVDLPQVEEAAKTGVIDFGENRALELKRKQEAFPNLNWHFIGRIQTNKLKDIVGCATLIHSISSIHAIEATDREAKKLKITQDILFQVNVSGEVSKDGFVEDELPSALASLENFENVSVKGLMTMAPISDPTAAKQCFEALALLKEKLEKFNGLSGRIQLKELSMGMSQDYPIAIQAGATMIRVGSSIFT
jgi:pyridoxal phosphate enzyme (YggS family)